MIQPEGVLVRTTARNFADTVEETRKVLRSVGQTIFAEIDQSAAAGSVNQSLRPTTIFVFGNPNAGTALMQSAPLLALDLPLKLLVWQGDDNTTRVAYRSVSSIAGVYGVPAVEARAAQIDGAIERLIDAIVSPSR